MDGGRFHLDLAARMRSREGQSTHRAEMFVVKVGMIMTYA